MAHRLDRAQVLAYRTWAQGLHGTGDLADLDALTVGLQDTPAGSAVLALRHRTAAAGPPDRPDLVLALTLRGSPHLHRRADLPLVRAALRPRDTEALRAYLGGVGDTMIAGGVDGPALLAQVAEELRAVFPGPTATKGDLSAAVTPRVPEVARPWCESCGTAHVADGLFRLATLHAGIELVPGEGRRLVFRLAGGDPAVAGDGDRAARHLLGVAVRLTGPLVLGDLAGWLDARATTAAPAWLRSLWEELLDRLVEVEVDGRTLHADPDLVERAGDVPAPPPLLLLPPRDAVLLGNRGLVVPDRELARELWRPVGSPGVLLVGGEPAGTWRARKSGKNLQVTVATGRRLTARQRSALDWQAEVVAEARGHAGQVAVAIE
jgi:hypothetical protein